MSILRELFGPSKEVIWNQLAQETGAIHTSGGFLKKSKVEASHGEWTITLDTHTVRSRRSSRYTTTNYTRFRAPYVNADNFFFTVYPEGFLASIGKSLGLVQDVIVGHDELDHNFVIQGNNEEKLKELFQNKYIRELLLNQENFQLTVQDNEGWFGQNYPDNTDLLEFKTYGIIKDVDRLKQLFYLFAETLDQLCSIGSAYKDHPGIHLIDWTRLLSEIHPV